MTTYAPDDFPRVIYVPWGGDEVGFRGEEAASLARSLGAVFSLPVVVYTNLLQDASDFDELKGWPVETLKSHKGPHGEHVSLYWQASDTLLMRRPPAAASGRVVIAEFVDDAMRGWAAVVGAINSETKMPVARRTPDEAFALLDEIARQGHNNWSSDVDKMLCRRPLDELQRQGWLHLEEAHGYLIAEHRAREAKIKGFGKLLAWHKRSAKRQTS